MWLCSLEYCIQSSQCTEINYLWTESLTVKSKPIRLFHDMLGPPLNVLAVVGYTGCKTRVAALVDEAEVAPWEWRNSDEVVLF